MRITTETSAERRLPRGAVNIGTAAEQSGISVKMIRYYESIGLVSPADRTPSNYRAYDHRAIRHLEFIRRARTLGFSLEEIRRLLALWEDDGRTSAEVKTLVLAHVAELNMRIDALRQMRQTLAHLAQACDGDDRPDCPIIDDLAGA